MADRTPKAETTDIGSRRMANPQIKVSVAEGIHRRLEEEADRLGVTLNDLVRFALFAALEAPRRLEDVKSLDARLAAIERRLKVVEGKGK